MAKLKLVVGYFTKFSSSWVLQKKSLISYGSYGDRIFPYYTQT
ncbi:hypothetical protein [Nostoc sp. TCL26-01]|nr:hypothetical protein [Nostoc sp. TCL26-01]